MSRTILIRILAVMFGFLLFWGLSEVVCRVVFTRVIAYDVEMWRYARQIKTTGLTDGLRFEHRPGVKAQLMGVDVSINKDGLRDSDVSRSKDETVYRIAVIGDSITFGWGVAEPQTYPRQIERILNKQRPLGPDVSFEVLNFGVGNYAIDDVAAMLKYKALGYAPDMVIYGAFLNDAEAQVNVESGPSVLRHSLSAVWLWGRLDRLWRQLGAKKSYAEYYLDLYRQGGEGRSRVREGVAAMSRVCQQRSIPLVVAMLPELHEGSTRSFAAVDHVYRDASVDAGAFFIDLQSVLPENNLRRFWVSPDDAHPNADAFALYSVRLADAIKENILREEGRK